MSSFDLFWSHYPRKISKRDASKAWKQTQSERPADGKLIAKVDELSRSEMWRKENGKWIPYPASWLRAGGWDDEVRRTVSCMSSVPSGVKRCEHCDWTGRPEIYKTHLLVVHKSQVGGHEALSRPLKP